MIEMPTDLFETGFVLTRTGYSLYQELTATAVFARTVGGVISAGCNVNCDHLSIQGYGSAFTVGMDLAATVQCSDDIRWGISILNINRPTIGQAKEPLPQWYLTGITCRVLSNASVSFLVCKDAMYPLSIRTGVKFSPLEALNLQIGTSNEPSRYYAGIGISYMSVEAEYSVVTHADLGLTHVIGLSFSP